MIGKTLLHYKIVSYLGVWDRDTEQTQEVEGIEFWERQGFFLSRDSRTILMQRLTRRSDIWMLEPGG